MVFPLVAWGWVVLAASSGFIVQHLAKPRLPVYTLQIQSLPWFEWIRGEGLLTFNTLVDLHNDNYVQIDVHGLAFDLFGMNWEGELKHVGHIQDKNLVQVDTHGSSSSSSFSWRKPPPAIWKIAPRANFTSSAELYIGCFLSRFYGTITRIVWSIWRGGGSLVLPTTGVAFIKANSQTPFTVSIVCDNLVNTWTLQVQGLECVLQQLKPGWSLTAIDTLRDHALSKLRANSTGGVLEHPTARWGREEVLRQIALEESLQLP